MKLRRNYPARARQRDARWQSVPSVGNRPSHHSDARRSKARTLVMQSGVATAAILDSSTAAQFRKRLVASIPTLSDERAEHALYRQFLRWNKFRIIWIFRLEKW